MDLDWLAHGVDGLSAAERPSMAEIVARAQARARATGSTVTMSDAVAAVRAARDRQEP